MTKKTAIIITSVLGISAVGFGAYRLGQGRPHRAHQEASSPSTSGEPEVLDRSADLAQAIRQLDRRLAALEVRQVQAAAPQAQTQKGPTPAEAAPFDPAAIKENERKRAAAIEAALRSEPRDPVWASVGESQLKGAVDAAIRESKAQFGIKSVKCLTSLCEMVLAAPNAEQLRGSHLELLPRVGEIGSLDFGVPEKAADGSATITYRMFRSGYPRPDEGT